MSRLDWHRMRTRRHQPSRDGMALFRTILAIAAIVAAAAIFLPAARSVGPWF